MKEKAEKVCPQCDAVAKTGDVCLSCGYSFVHGAMPEVMIDSGKKKQKDSSDEVTMAESVDTPASEDSAPEEHQQITSLFGQMGPLNEEVSFQIQKSVSKVKKVVPAVLVVILLAIAVISYFSFVGGNTEFASPLVLSAQDIRALRDKPQGAVAADEIPLTDIANASEKTLEMKIPFVEGNFDQTEFAQFTTPTTNLLIKAFSFGPLTDSLFVSDDIKNAKKFFTVTTDDIDVYFSKGFAVMYPNENLDTWGFAIGVKPTGVDFVTKRLGQLKKEEENKKSDYLKYHAVLVESLPENGDKEDIAKIEVPTTAPDTKTTATKPIPTDKKEETPAVPVLPSSDKLYYLLVSNSKEYLDQMKESAEGNLPNLRSDIKYAQTLTDLPKVGQVYIYKKADSPAWIQLGLWAGRTFNYTGLEKIFETVKAQAVLVTSANDKVKLTPSKE